MELKRQGNIIAISLNEADSQNPETMEAFNEVMNAWQDAMIEECKRVSDELSVSDQCASSVQYLRTRSRWTQEKEDQLIEWDQSGIELPNVFAGDF